MLQDSCTNKEELIDTTPDHKAGTDTGPQIISSDLAPVIIPPSPLLESLLQDIESSSLLSKAVQDAIPPSLLLGQAIESIKVPSSQMAKMLANIAPPSQFINSIEDALRPSLELNQKIASAVATMSRHSQMSQDAAASILQVHQRANDLAALLQYIKQTIESITIPSLQLAQNALATSLLGKFNQNLPTYSSAFNNLFSSMKTIQEWIPPNLRHLKEAIQHRLLLIFQQANLWPTPSMSEDLIDQIDWLVVGSELRSSGQLIRLVWDYYTENDYEQLEHAISSWWADPEFAARRKIIKRALQNHKLRWYETSIPALLAQLEGIASEFVHRSGYTLKTATGRTLELGKSTSVVQRTLEVMGGIDNMDIEAMDITHLVMVKASVQYIQNVSYKRTEFQTQYAELREQQELSRHGVLHGIQINYSSPMNSLRCFLLLDALYGVRRYYEGLYGNDNQ